MTSQDTRSRHHRRKRLLIYRPSPNDSLNTPPPARLDLSSPRGLLHNLHLASPMEREKRRILSVELRDIGCEVKHLQVKTSPCQRTLGSDEWPVCDRLSSTSLCNDLAVISQSSTVLPCPTELPSHTLPTCQPPLIPPPLLPPKEEPGWGLVPLFNSVRSKLESFAEIFLTPVKSRRDAQNSEDSAPPGEPSSASGGVYRGTVQPSTLFTQRFGVDPEEHGLNDHSSASENNLAPSQLQRTPPHQRQQMETSQSPSILCHPPLQRYLSCPLLPLKRYKRRHSVDPMEFTTEPFTCRRRCHSLGSVEECQNLPLIPFSLSCLRKENHPSVLRQSSYPPGDVRKPPNGSVHNEGSPPGLCLDKDIEQGLSAAEEQVTRESLPDSDFKSPGSLSCSKENKVSNIQIRKRALRQEEKLTPLGLPKRVRLQKEDFSLEEIYTNKNYHTPTEKRKFETIFEEPIMKGGTLILTSQRPLRRIMIFKDGGSAPRKRKKKGKAAGRTRRYTAASAEENINYELLLQHKLNQLEAALQEEASEP